MRAVKILSIFCIVMVWMARSGQLRIGDLSRRVGVSPELLRAWEPQYGLLQEPAATTNLANDAAA